MFRFPFIILMGAALALATAASTARADSHVPTPALAKTALEATKRNWVAFRNYNGRQLVYFTHLVTWHCAMTSIRYSYNGADDWKSWPVPACNEDVPYAVNPETDKLYETFKLGSIETVAVEITLSDGQVLPVRAFKPCNVPGDTTCGKPAD